MQTEGMSAYERHAWEQVAQWRERELRERRRLVPASWQEAAERGVKTAQGAAQRGWGHVPRHDDVTAALSNATNGLNNLVTDAALKTIRDEAIIAAFQRRDLPVTELADIQRLDLQHVDRVMPDLRFRYAAGLAGEGAAAGAAAGGATVIATAGGIAGAGAGAVPGVAATAGIIAADLSALLSVTTRGAAHYASYYGYDVTHESEQAYLVGTMSVGLATGQAAKSRAFAQLHKLLGMLARDATWRQLNEMLYVRFVNKLYQRLGERLVKRKLGQTVPVAGAAIGAGLNYQFARGVMNAAYWIGRERFLMDKYDLHQPPGPEFDGEILDVEEAAERLQILAEDDEGDEA